MDIDDAISAPLVREYTTQGVDEQNDPSPINAAILALMR